MAPPSNIENKPHREEWDNANPFDKSTSAHGESENRKTGNPPETERRHSDETASTLVGTERNDSSDTNTAIEQIKNLATSARRKFHLQSIHATGPSRLFNPTQVRTTVRWGSSESESARDARSSQEKPTRPQFSKEQSFIWRSRDNRKGRNSIVVRKNKPTAAMKVRHVRRNLWKMCSTFPYWDMAFWSGWSYTIGSIIFVIDGVWAWGPKAYENFESESLEKYGPGLCFCIGALFYQLGASIAYFEAINDGSFQGSAMRRFLEGDEENEKKMLDEKLHHFFGHFVPSSRRSRDESQAENVADAVDPEAGWRNRDRPERPGSVYPLGKRAPSRRGGMDLGVPDEGETYLYSRWRWWPTWKALKTHHVYEIGYIACAVQLFGATLYGMCGVVSLHWILSTLSQWQKNAAYWIPQMIASACFLTAGCLFTVETQEKWYRPEPKAIGWWIGVWATVGSMGFLLCAVLGPASANSGAAYQSDLASLWGSAAYLMSGFLQWYEAVNKNPIEEMFNERGEMKSHQIHPI